MTLRARAVRVGFGTVHQEVRVGDAKMEKYALAKLVQWSGTSGVAGRKRLQKIVFFLQKAGCPFGADYSLHHYGPYSRDLAETCDELVAAGLLNETVVENNFGRQYTYRMTPAGTSALNQTDQRLRAQANDLAKFQPLAAELLPYDLWELELGSTILYFYEKSLKWDDATRLACEFKRIDRTDKMVASAEALAKRIDMPAQNAVPSC